MIWSSTLRQPNVQVLRPRQDIELKLDTKTFLHKSLHISHKGILLNYSLALNTKFNFNSKTAHASKHHGKYEISWMESGKHWKTCLKPSLVPGAGETRDKLKESWRRTKRKQQRQKTKRIYDLVDHRSPK